MRREVNATMRYVELSFEAALSYGLGNVLQVDHWELMSGCLKL